MMSDRGFAGFPDRPTYLPVPASFFGALLREIDDLAEWKLTLHCWRLLYLQKGHPRFVRRSALLADRALQLAMLTCDPETPGRAIASALELACRRGIFVSVELDGEAGRECCYFLNTPANRRVVERVVAGEYQLEMLRPVPEAGQRPLAPRPRIYELYEQNVGLLTPLIAEELQEAELQFPADWIEDAFREAVAYNRRNWRYIRRILDNWATRGRGERGATRGRAEPPEDPSKYLQGRFGRYVKR